MPVGRVNVNLGTTSACAENTVVVDSLMGEIRNYLRVRGEYPQKIALIVGAAELPPRARRIRTIFLPRPMLFGTTSACAENTP